MGYIGAALVTVTPNVANQLNYQGKGVAVEQVVRASAADSAGLQPGDVIQKTNGKDVTAGDRAKVIQRTKPGSTISLQVWSGGVKGSSPSRSSERPADGRHPAAGPAGPAPASPEQPEEQP